MKTVFSLIFLVAAVALSSAFVGKVNPFFQDDPNSCIGRCNRTGTIPNGCQCNPPCMNFNDCCDDYYTLCLDQGNPGSCVGKCGAPLDPSASCQCNTACISHNDCCPDYREECGSQEPEPITNAEIEALTEELFALEAVNPNRVSGYVTWDLQGPSTPQGCGSDSAPNPLLNVHPNAYTIGTTALLVALHDNYNAQVSIPETESTQETEEINAFIDAVLATPIMQRTEAFLTSKGVAFTRAKFLEMWFGLYSRSSGVLGSSGIEHVFLGELNSGVSGFHNWAFFAKEEEAGRINYLGWMKFLDLGNQGALIQHRFTWQGQCKPISSMFVGTTPEFELAVFSLCWFARPGSTNCPASFGQRKVKITTYTIGSNQQFVASSYADPA